MFMENLRTAKHKWKKPMTILIALIIVGLLSSYALIGSQLGISGTSGTPQSKINTLKSESKTAEKALKKDPANKEMLVSAIEARYSLGEIELVMGRTDDGIDNISKALEHMKVLDGIYGTDSAVTSQEKLDLYNRMGASYWIVEDYDNFNLTFKKALGISPKNTDILNTYIGLLMQGKEYDKALDILNSFKAGLTASDTEAINTVDSLISSVKSAKTAATSEGANMGEQSAE